MKRLLPLIFLFIYTSLFAEINNLQETIRNYVESKPESTRYTIDNELLYSSQLMPRFYLERGFSPAWLNNSKPNQNALTLIHAIRTVDDYGLEPMDYHLLLIELYMEKLSQSDNVDLVDQMKFEILLTDSFLLLSSHLYFGKVNPEHIEAEWRIQRKEPDLRFDQRLQHALVNNDIAAAFENLSPKFKSYETLKQRLAFFRGLVDLKWDDIQLDKAIKPGEQSTRLPLFRQRLKLLGFNVIDVTSDYYDTNFETEVKRFQTNNGLNPDGVIGRMTAQAINIKPSERIASIRVNMERIRWLPLQFPQRYILVNIANAELDLINGDDTLVRMRAIVGRNYRKTPVFSANMTYLVFSPSWNIPPGILRNDVLPELKKGPEYLQNKNMSILRFDGTSVDYASIDWNTITAANFPFIVRQNPGADNALGKVKFMFPNQYNVYIHDTPSRGLFAQEERALSSGCIRIEHPFELAQKLLADSPQWTPERIRNAMDANREQTVKLPFSIPVFMVYFTAWTDGSDKIQFRKDVYNRDAAVLNALKQKPDNYILDNRKVGSSQFK